MSGICVPVAIANGSAGSVVTSSVVEVLAGRAGATSTSLATFFFLESSSFDGSWSCSASVERNNRLKPSAYKSGLLGL